MHGPSELRLEDIPQPDADWNEIAKFAHTFDGYRHFGDEWSARWRDARKRYFERGAVSADPDDLRALLFLEFRSDRFMWGEDVLFQKRDDGDLHVVLNPDYETTRTARYRRAMLRRLRELCRRCDLE